MKATAYFFSVEAWHRYNIKTILFVLIICLTVASCSSAQHVRFSAIYLDLDGTALGPDDQVRPATTLALSRFRACGGHVGVATGRGKDQARHALDVLRPDLPVALYNGAMLVSPDQSVILNVVTLPEAALLRAFDAARTMPSVGGVVRQDTEATIADRSEPRFDAFVAQKGMKIDAIEPSLPATRARGHMKLLLFVPAGDVAEVSSAMTDVVGPFGARAVVTSDATVEIVPSKASKASSIRQALAMTGIDPRDVVAIGDSQNDVEMLLEMGVGVAMGNCRPEACAAAIAKIGANDTDAIAEFIHRVVVVNACGTSALAE